MAANTRHMENLSVKNATAARKLTAVSSLYS